MTSTTSARQHDIVLYGATGFVGRLTAEYLARSAPRDLRIALAGRSEDKLARVQGELPPAAREWPLVIADSSDRASLDALAQSTRVVVTTVGPYAKYGLPLVEACARAGTHYADLTGEVLFVRDSIDAAHDVARENGARIVHSCGFDSVPSDLGVLLAAEQAAADGAGELSDAVMLVASMKGEFSGGTFDSIRTQIDEAKADGARRRVMTDPYALSPDRDAEPDLGKESDLFLTRREKAFDGQWVAPFVMASFNTRIVRRSNALRDHAYGRRMRYQEVMSVGRSPAAPLLASGMALGVGALAGGMALPPTRFVIDRLLPSPGEGPSEESREKGHFTTKTVATTTSGARYRTTMKAKGDPGYKATSVMLGESALALALDDLPDAAGVLTPATGIGTALAGRLRTAGFVIEVERLG